MLFLLLLILPGVRSEDPVTNLLDSISNRKYNGGIPHVNPAKPTNGPVLFPNDGPLPPPTPLVVTSRPLIQAIVDKINQTNAVAEQSQVDQVTYRPYLARQKTYVPFAYTAPTAQPLYARPTSYDDVSVRGDIDYYDDKPLHPIYKAFADHARADLKQKVKQVRYNQISHRDPDDYQNNNSNGEDKDYNQGENYAFSYTVRDKATGDDFSHKQKSTGSGTNGEYRVRLPDGRMQIVSYTADENGYKADVRYDDNEKNTDINTKSFKNRYITDVSDNHIYDSKSDYFYNDKTRDVPQPVLNFDYKNDRRKVSTSDYLDNDKPVPAIPDNTGFRAENEDTDFSYHYVDETENDFSKEYKDYSGESKSYHPQISKFESFVDNKDVAQSTVKPAYEDIKHLFVTFKNRLNTPTPVIPSEPVFRIRDYETTTERIVFIGGKRSNLYTNIRDSKDVNNKPFISPKPVVYTTPSTFLYSTITNLKNKISLFNKPELSNNFINKISRYLTYK